MKRRSTGSKARRKSSADDILDNPVVQEIRAIRARMWKDGGGTVEGYLKLVQREAKEVQRRRPTARAKPRRRAG